MTRDLSIECVCGKMLKRKGGFGRIAPHFFKEHISTSYHKKRSTIPDHLLIKEQEENYYLDKFLNNLVS